MQRKDHVITKESSATVPTKHLEFWLAAFELAGFDAIDIGERVTTDDGLDAEAVLAVTLKVPQRVSEVIAA